VIEIAHPSDRNCTGHAWSTKKHHCPQKVSGMLSDWNFKELSDWNFIFLIGPLQWIPHLNFAAITCDNLAPLLTSGFFVMLITGTFLHLSLQSTRSPHSNISKNGIFGLHYVHGALRMLPRWKATGNFSSSSSQELHRYLTLKYNFQILRCSCKVLLSCLGVE
jgi:hypothetical protein